MSVSIIYNVALATALFRRGCWQDLYRPYEESFADQLQ